MKEIKTYILPSLAVLLWGVVIGLIIGSLAIPKGEVITKTETVEVEKDPAATLELSEETLPALVETVDGELEELDVPTLEEVDGGQITDTVLDPDTAGQGAYFDTSTWQAFKNATLGNCYSLNNPFGSQCVNLAVIFWENYANTKFTTCGTGAAKGAWNCKEQIAGDDFVLITDPAELQAGDWIITGDGTWGHVAMAVGPYNKGYIAVLGTNQGGRVCERGGAAANIVNLGLKGFLGAFRPKSYIIPVPTPVSEPVPAAPNTGAGVQVVVEVVE